MLLATDSINPDSKDRNSQTPLSCAAGNGHDIVVKILLATDGINPDSKDTEGQKPLWWAARNGHEAVAKLLLATDGIDPDSKDTYGQTLLLWAAENEHETVVKLLLQNGADICIENRSRWTALQLAALNKHERGRTDLSDTWSI
jgi:ankyrin repeat protein